MGNKTDDGFNSSEKHVAFQNIQEWEDQKQQMEFRKTLNNLVFIAP
jgi:hypothetical protein